VEGLGFTKVKKVKIVLETTKLMCKATLNFEVIFMPGLNIKLDDNNNIKKILLKYISKYRELMLYSPQIFF